VKVDGEWKKMPDGYPKFSSQGQGANNFVTIRIPQFKKKALYDPIVDPGKNPNAAAVLRASSMLLIACLLPALPAYKLFN